MNEAPLVHGAAVQDLVTWLTYHRAIGINRVLLRLRERERWTKEAEKEGNKGI